MPKFISFCFIYLFSSTGGAYCVVKDITKIDNELISCKQNQLLFGYLKFESNISNFQYIHEKSLNVKIILDYHQEILNFILNYCEYKKNTLKIKEITNLKKSGSKKFINEVIISCKYKP